MEEATKRAMIVEACRSLNSLGLSQGTSGNISLRHDDAMLISPSATPYDAMRPEDIARVTLAGDGAWEGPRKPSTEWRFHHDILRARPEAQAVVHTHAPWCTTLAVTRRPIPASHYMVALFGGNDVRCAPYATFGTQELSDHALAALEGRNGCLLANHGMIVLAQNLARAMWLAVELETLARVYCQSLAIGGPVILSPAEIEETARRFSGYGRTDT